MISKHISSFLFICAFLYNFPLLGKETSFKKAWKDTKGQHDVIITIKENIIADLQQVTLSGKSSINNQHEWTIYDYVKDCPVDANIAINPKLFEHIDLDKTNNDYLLFAYSISCRGGIDPEDVKYFAYQNGQKYTIKGEQTIIIGKEKFGGEKKLIINSNLQKNLPLLNYMQKKWLVISTYDYNKNNQTQ